MPHLHLYLLGQPIRAEQDPDLIANLVRKGWEVLPRQPDPTATWDGEQWVTPEPPGPEPDYRGFWDAALTSNVYQALYTLSTVDLPVNAAVTAFTASFQDAKDGRPNPGAIQSCIGLVMQAAAGHLAAEHLSELQGLLDAHHLSSIYTLTP
jgi:hypothetical protein